VIAIPGNGQASELVDGVAVISRNWWLANKARSKLAVQWDNGEWSGHSTKDYDAQARALMTDGEPADSLNKKGVSCTVVDPRTTSPLDTETILETVEETGRLVVVDESHPRCSMATDIVSLVTENIFGALKAAPKTVTGPHAPVPFSPVLEDMYVPSPAKIEAAVLAVMDQDRKAAAE
jgi:hypothetical protein